MYSLWDRLTLLLSDEINTYSHILMSENRISGSCLERELSYFLKLFDPPQGFIIEKSGLD